MSKDPYDLAQRDFMMLPFLLLGSLRLIALLDRPGEMQQALLVGICTGAMFWLKPVALAYAGLSVLAIGVSHSGKQRYRALSILALGWLIVAAFIQLWLYRLGGLANFYQTFFTFALPVFSAMGGLFADLRGWAGVRLIDCKRAYLPDVQTRHRRQK